jgi:hypothetical protein
VPKSARIDIFISAPNARVRRQTITQRSLVHLYWRLSHSLPALLSRGSEASTWLCHRTVLSGELSGEGGRYPKERASAGIRHTLPNSKRLISVADSALHPIHVSQFLFVQRLPRTTVRDSNASSMTSSYMQARPALIKKRMARDILRRGEQGPLEVSQLRST